MVVGTGDKAIEAAFTTAAKTSPKNVACFIGYDERLVVGRVGGLNDTVIDANGAALAKGCATGVQFSPINPHMLAAAINRSFALYAQPEIWDSLVRNCLSQDVSWTRSAADYASLYTRLKG